MCRYECTVVATWSGTGPHEDTEVDAMSGYAVKSQVLYVVLRTPIYSSIQIRLV